MLLFLLASPYPLTTTPSTCAACIGFALVLPPLAVSHSVLLSALVTLSFLCKSLAAGTQEQLENGSSGWVPYRMTWESSLSQGDDIKLSLCWTQNTKSAYLPKWWWHQVLNVWLWCTHAKGLIINITLSGNSCSCIFDSMRPVCLELVCTPHLSAPHSAAICTGSMHGTRDDMKHNANTSYISLNLTALIWRTRIVTRLTECAPRFPDTTITG